MGKFKAPTLRNIAVTAPYMHDGSVATLEDAIDHYAAGGRTIADGPYRGVGRDNPNKSPTIRGFALTAAQRADLVAFLRCIDRRGAPARPAIRQSVGQRAQAVAEPKKPMSPKIRRPLDWLFALCLLIGMPTALAAQRPPTIAAAANLNFALTEIAKQFEQAQGTRVRARVRRIRS